MEWWSRREEKGRLILALFLCGVLVVAGAESVAPRLLLVYRSFSYVFGAVEPTGGPYDDVAFGSEGLDELHCGPRDDLLASEGPWGQYPDDYRPDRLHGGPGDDYLDAVSWPYPSVDVVRCGSARTWWWRTRKTTWTGTARRCVM